MTDVAILETLLVRLKERAEYAQFATGDPGVESFAVPIFVVEDVIADLTKHP